MSVCNNFDKAYQVSKELLRKRSWYIFVFGHNLEVICQILKFGDYSDYFSAPPECADFRVCQNVVLF